MMPLVIRKVMNYSWLSEIGISSYIITPLSRHTNSLDVPPCVLRHVYTFLQYREDLVQLLIQKFRPLFVDL